MSLQKYLNESSANKVVLIDSSGFISLVYYENVFSLPAFNVFKFSDVNYDFNLLLPGKKKKAFNSTIVSDTAYFQIIPQTKRGMKLDSMILSAGILSLTMNNSQNLQGTYSITFPGILNKGKALQMQYNLSQTNPSPLDLSSNTIQFISHSDSDNYLEAIVILNIDSTGIIVPGSQLLNMAFTLHNIQYSVFYGFAGETSIPINKGSFPLNFYNRLLGGNFYFLNPKIKMLFTNSYGVPFDIFFADIRAITNFNGSMIVSGVPGSAHPKAINYPLVPYSLAKDSIILDTTNSNIRTILSEVPTQITFSIEDSLNPFSLPAHQNFITDSSKFEANLEVVLPLQGHTDSLLLLEDTLNFQFASFIYKNPQEVSTIYFQLYVKNDFPVEIVPQVYFTDDRFHPLDSLITSISQQAIKAAGIDANGTVNQPNSSTITIKFPRSRIQNIENATHIITYGKFRTRASNVKFLNTYYLDFNIGVIVQLQINTSL